MRESNLSPIPLLLLSGLAMVSGLGLLLFELITGVLHRSLPSMFLWGSYLVLLLTSVWGMKTWIELQTELWARYRRTLPGLPGRSGQQAVHSHNLFRLPAEGQIYVLMLAIMLLGALFGKTNTLMLIFALMAGPFIVNGGISFSMTRRLELKRALPGRIMLGEPASVDITIENRKRWVSSCLVSVEDRIVGPREILNGRLMFALVPPSTSRTGRYQVRFMQRGRYRIGPARVTSRFPLGIVERGRQIESYAEMLVYPRIGYLANWWLRRLTDGQEASRVSQGQTGAHHDEFHRIREYRQGDELRSIHWKTSASRNELMVREYRPNRDRRLLLILDLWQPGSVTGGGEKQMLRQRERVELAVCLAATLGWNYLQECGPQQLDYIGFGDQRRQWLGSQLQQSAEVLLDQLALADAGDQFSLHAIETEIIARQTGATRCVLITTRDKREYLSSKNAQDHESAGIWQGLTILEAEPESVAEYFQPNPID